MLSFAVLCLLVPHQGFAVLCLLVPHSADPLLISSYLLQTQFGTKKRCYDKVLGKTPDSMILIYKMDHMISEQVFVLLINSVTNFSNFCFHLQIIQCFVLRLFLYLTREFYCFVKHINIETFHFTSCNILQAREFPKPEWQTLLDAYHPFKQTNKSIPNSWFQAFQALSI